MVAAIFKARAKAYSKAAFLLGHDFLGTTIEVEQRKRVIKELRVTAKNNYKHAVAVLKFEGDD